MLIQKLRMEFHISRLVNTVDISEPSGDGKEGANGGQSLIDLVDIFRLSIQ